MNLWDYVTTIKTLHQVSLCGSSDKAAAWWMLIKPENFANYTSWTARNRYLKRAYVGNTFMAGDVKFS